MHPVRFAAAVQSAPAKAAPEVARERKDKLDWKQVSGLTGLERLG